MLRYLSILLVMTTGTFGMSGMNDHAFELDVLNKTVEALSTIKTVSYDLDRKWYQQAGDTVHMADMGGRRLECFQVVDSVRSPYACNVSWSADGAIERCFDGTWSYYRCGDGYYKNDLGTMYGTKYVTNEFFSLMSLLCGYLVAHPAEMHLRCTDGGESWTVEADTVCNEQLIFTSTSIFVPSNPDTRSWFRIKIDKNTHLPYHMSRTMGNPACREVYECRNLSMSSQTGFDAESLIGPGLMTDEEYRQWYPNQMRKIVERVMSEPVPGDSLPMSDGNWFSMSGLKGKTAFVYFTSATCGVCMTATPVINRIIDDYSDKGVVVASVMLEDISPEAAELFRSRSGLKCPVAVNRNEFYENYIGMTYSPLVMIVKPDGYVKKIVFGMSHFVEPTEREYRKNLDECLAGMECVSTGTID